MTLQEVLRGGRQCDEDGVEIIMSREACVKAADALDEKDRRIEELKGALMACLEKGARWHPCDPVVVKARAALKGE